MLVLDSHKVPINGCCRWLHVGQEWNDNILLLLFYPESPAASYPQIIDSLEVWSFLFLLKMYLALVISMLERWNGASNQPEGMVHP